MEDERKTRERTGMTKSFLIVDLLIFSATWNRDNLYINRVSNYPCTYGINEIYIGIYYIYTYMNL